MTPKQRTVTSGQRRSGAAGAPASAWQASDRQGAVTTLPNTHSVSPNAAAHRLHVTRFPFYRRGATQRQTQEEAQAPPGAPGSRPGAAVRLLPPAAVRAQARPRDRELCLRPSPGLAGTSRPRGDAWVGSGGSGRGQAVLCLGVPREGSVAGRTQPHVAVP